MKQVWKALPYLFIAVFAWTWMSSYRAENETADAWFMVNLVHVEDTIEGQVPLMAVNRLVMKSFTADWIVTVRKVTGDGAVVVCLNNGKSYYTNDAILPKPLTLEWWLEEPCKLEPGSYRVDTVWYLELPGYASRKQVKRSSNVFQVLPKT